MGTVVFLFGASTLALIPVLVLRVGAEETSNLTFHKPTRLMRWLWALRTLRLTR